LQAGEATSRDALRRLYRWLIQPIVADLGPPGTPLIIVADGELAAAPFAALADPASRKFLVEAHPLRFTARLSDVIPSAAQARPKEDVLLALADPAFDERASPGLQRLPGARAEAEAVRRLYAHGTLLIGADVQRAALHRALVSTTVVHYAGHAIIDDERPERSYLFVSTSATEPDRLTASEVSGLGLDHVRLVVLSGCRTLSARPGHSGGLGALAAALLEAGAGGVIGSLWTIDDRLTSAFMIALHEEYVKSGDGVLALRVAQLRMIHAADPALRSATVWAGFRYFGR
jgi:CHAT domain-containing protein